MSPDPLPYRFDRTALAAQLHERFGSLEAASQTGEQVAVAGRVLLLRSFGKLAFATIRDNSGRIQVMAELGEMGE
ncbi:MAG TPA: OB-fold nucleic acid binding domain-containing protein, partial [Acidimicrobiia bacterium]|nr:OB-fold nucleic acid binding domain-containing protein [Acidimicrobiia bacterium]